MSEQDDKDKAQSNRPENPLFRGGSKKAKPKLDPGKDVIYEKRGWMPNSEWKPRSAPDPRPRHNGNASMQPGNSKRAGDGDKKTKLGKAGALGAAGKFGEMAKIARDRKQLTRRAAQMAASFWTRSTQRAGFMATRNPINRLILSRIPAGWRRNAATTACGCSTCCAGCSSCATVMPCGLPLIVIILILVVFMFAVVGQIPDQAKPLFCEDDVALGIDCSDDFAIAFDADEIPVGAVDDYKTAEEATGVPWFYLMAWEKMTTNFGRADLSTGEALPAELIELMNEQTAARLEQMREAQDLTDAEFAEAEETLYKEAHMSAARLSSNLRGGSYGLVLLTAEEWKNYGKHPEDGRLLNPWLRADASMALAQMLTARFADHMAANVLFSARVFTDAAQVDLIPLDDSMRQYLISTWESLQNEQRKSEFVQFMYADAWPSDTTNPRSEERITLEERHAICNLIKNDIEEVTDEQCKAYERGSNSIVVTHGSLREQVAEYYDPEAEGADRVSDWPKLRILMGALMNLDDIWGAEQSANFTIPARDNEGRSIPDSFQNVNIYPYGINLYARTAFEGWLLYEQIYLNNTLALGGALTPADVPAMQFWRPHLEAAAAKYHVNWADLAAYMDVMTSFGRNVGDTAPSEERRWSEPLWVEGVATQEELMARLLAPYPRRTPELQQQAERTATAILEAEEINCLPGWDSFLGMSPEAIEGEDEEATPINVPCLNPIHGITADGFIGPAAFRLTDWAGPDGYGIDAGVTHSPFDPQLLTEALARKLHAEALTVEGEAIAATTEPDLRQMMPAWASMVDCVEAGGSQSQPILILDEAGEKIGEWPYCRELNMIYERAKAYRATSGGDLTITDTWLKPNTIAVGKAMAAELGFTGMTWVPLAVQIMWETGGNINYNNPTGLTGDGGALVWEGQSGWTSRLCPINNATGQPECHYFAVFGTLSAGGRASASNYATGSVVNGYDKVLAAGRAGDPIALARAIEDSRWNTDHYIDPANPDAPDGRIVTYTQRILASATPIYTGEWQWPLRGSWVITQEYGLTSFSSFHSGIDMDYTAAGCVGNTNQPIYASASGTVVADGQPYAKYDSAIGVIIDHGGDVKSLYWHMDSELVSVGQRITAGDVIGYVGTTGNSTGCHLHMEVLVRGSHTNPRLVLPVRPADRIR